MIKEILKTIKNEIKRTIELACFSGSINSTIKYKEKLDKKYRK